MDLLGELGEVSDSLRKKIMKEADLEILSKWLKIAAKAGCVSEFEKKMEED